MVAGRLHSLDIARGIASLAVVFWHWKHFFYDRYAIADDFSAELQPFYSQLSILYIRGGTMAVTFFFALSGFVFFWLYRDKIANRECTLRQYCGARFARLYPLHLLTLIAVAALQWVYWQQHGSFFVYEFNDAYHFVLNLFFATKWGLQKGWSYNGPIWSVSIEVALYGLFFVLAFLRFATARCCIAIISAMFLVIRYRDIGGVPLAIEAFFVGGLTWIICDWYSHRRSRIVDAIVVVTALASWVGVMCSERIALAIVDRNELYVLVLCPITITALVICERTLDAVLKRMSWIGDITYSTYLLHFPLQLVFVIVASALGLQRYVFYSSMVLLTFFLVLIPLSIVTFHYFERPSQKWLRTRLL